MPRLRPWSTSLFVVCATAGAAVMFFLSWKIEFIYDDIYQIVFNEHIKHGLSWRWLSSDPLRPQRLIQNATFAINWAVSGPSRWSWHLFSVGLHLANAILLFGLLRRLRAPDPGIVWLGCLLFLLHPLQLESVSYIMGRNEVLKLLATLVALHLYLAPRRPRVLLHFFLAVCLLVKETMAITPFLFVALDLTVGGVSWRRLAWREHVFYCSHVLWFLFWRLLLDFNTQAAVIGFHIYPFWDYVVSNLHYAWFYLKLAVDPAGQAIYHDWVARPPLWQVLAGSGFLMGIAAVGIRARQRNPVTAFMVIFFAVAYLPHFSILQFINPFAENRLYQANAGLAYLAMAGLFVILRSRRVAIIISVLALAYFCVWHVALLRLWRDPNLVWSYASEKYPDSAVINTLLGTYHARRGRCLEALRHFERGCRNHLRDSARANCQAYQGVLYVWTGNRQAGVAMLRELLQYPAHLRTAVYYNEVIYLAAVLGTSATVAQLRAEAEKVHPGVLGRTTPRSIPTKPPCE